MGRVLTSSLVHHIRILYYINRLRKNQWLKEEDLAYIQEKRLRMIIHHAYHNVPYYHEIFDAHSIKPDDIRSVDDLHKIPITTKREIQSNYPDKIIAKVTDINQLIIKRTTGSTGRPLEICFGQKSLAYYAALGYYAFFERGLRFTDKMVSIEVPNNPAQRTWFQRLGILRYEAVSLLQPVRTIIEELRVIKPDVIYGFPSILSLLAREIEMKNIAGISPRMVLTHAETLTDHSRKEISDAFNTEVYDTYGSVEFSNLAFECDEHSGYHMISDGAIIEFIKEGKNIRGCEPGDIVVTGLYNYEMPLIRYKLGDVGIPSNRKCSCGRGFPLMNSPEGRTDDLLILPSGRIISPRAINIIEYIPGITEYRTIQEEKDRFVVQVVKGKGFNQETISQIERQIKVGCLGENVRCEVEVVKELPRERTGKLRTVVSKVRGQHESNNMGIGV
ncbi:phenylacetate--CoA ligase family protein [Chloroflexota bacterium]